MEHIEIFVHQFYNHAWYYPYMTDAFRTAIEEAFSRDEKTVMVRRADLENMFGQFLLRISN